LFNTATLRWDEELGRIFDVPLSLLPEVRSSDSAFGALVAGATALNAGIPIRGVMGDSHAALYGHGIRSPGAVKATYGTGSSLMTLTGKRISSTHGLSGTIAWSTEAGGVVHALEGNISVAGQAAAFMAEMLGLADSEALSALALTVADSNGVVFVPALVGLGAPYWRDDVRGLVSGLSLGTKRAHLARAALEAIAFQVADVFRAMESDLGGPLSGLATDGGASRNDFLMQFQADILDRPVARSDVAELSALGVAQLAATGLGWPSNWQEAAPAAFTPTMPAPGREAALARWRTAIAKTLG
jgi:glycerol kinase